MDVKFEFEKTEKIFFGIIYRPVAKVTFQSPKKHSIWLDTWMVVDTGADFTILPRYMSSDLFISLENDCIKDITLGIGGQSRIFLCKLKITAKIGTLIRRIPFAFFDNDEVPPLLGRLGFLETFDTEFLKNHTVIFKE